MSGQANPGGVPADEGLRDSEAKMMTETQMILDTQSHLTWETKGS